MRDVTSTTSRSRSVLGTMNDYAIYIEAVFRHDFTVSLRTLSVKLADTRSVRSITTNRGTGFVGCREKR